MESPVLGRNARVPHSSALLNHQAFIPYPTSPLCAFSVEYVFRDGHSGKWVTFGGISWLDYTCQSFKIIGVHACMLAPDDPVLHSFSPLYLSIQCFALPTFYKHRRMQFFPAWAFTVPGAILRIPFSLVDATIYTLIVYFPTGLAPTPGRFFIFWGFFILSSQVWA